MTKKSKKPVGRQDWQITLALIVFVILSVCSVYCDLKILKYFAIIPAVYAVARSFFE